MLKFLIEFLPVIAFFISYSTTNDLMLSVVVLMIATTVSVIASYLILKKVETLLWVGALFVLVFGFISISLQDSSFIQAKTSVFGAIMALVLLFSPYFGKKKPLMQLLLDKQIPLSDADWKTINMMWVIFFILQASFNYYAWQYWSEQAWVFFKVWGLLFMNIVFVLIQGVFIYKRLKNTDSHQENQISP